MRKNIGNQTIAFQMNSATDGSAVTSGTPTVYYTIDGGAQGTGAGVKTHEGNGQWSYVPAQAETNGAHIAFTMAIAGAVSQTVNVWPVAYDPGDAVRLGITALPNAAADAAGGLPISDGGGLNMDAILVDTNNLNGTKIPNTLNTTASGNIGIDWANVENPTTALDLSGTDIQLVDTVTTYTGNTPQTADHTAGIADIPTVAELNARTLAAASYFDPAADTVATVTTVTNQLTPAEIESECNDALVALGLDHLVAVADADNPVNDSIMAKIAASDGDWSGYDPATDALEAIRTEGDLSWGSSGTNPNVLLSAEIATVSTQTNFTLATGSDVDGAYDDQAIVLYDDTNSDFPSVRKVITYTGATKTVEIDSAPDFTLGTDDSVRVFVTAPGTTAPTAAQNRIEMDSNSTQLAAIVADTNELQTDDVPSLINALPTSPEIVNEWETQSQADPTGFHVNVIEVGGTAQTANDNGADINAILADTNELQADDVPGAITTAFTEIKGATWSAGSDTLEHIRDKQTAIGLETAELQTDWADGGRLDLLVDAIKAVTDVLNNLSAADINAQVVDVMRVDAMAQLSDAAPTSTPTMAAALMHLYSALTNKIDVSASEKEFYNAAGDLIWRKALSEDGTNYIEAKGRAGS